jgi:hypothetical protein
MADHTGHSETLSKICHEMATSIRSGKADDSNGIPALDTLQSHGVLHLNVDSSTNADVISILEKAQWTRKLRDDATTQFIYDGGGVGIAWLGHGGAGAIMQNAGLDRCTHFFFSNCARDWHTKSRVLLAYYRAGGTIARRRSKTMHRSEALLRSPPFFRRMTAKGPIT